MNQAPSTLVLASRSPRRAALLREAAVAFVQLAPPFEDPSQPNNQSGVTADVLVASLAARKAESLKDSNRLAGIARWVVLAADTIVVDADGLLLGQPSSRDDARSMLQRLIGAAHRVYTGVVMLDHTGGEVIAPLVDSTLVRLGPVTPSQLDTYLDSGQWRGKAGAYNLFERQSVWPFSVEGDPTTVVGLPMERLRQCLAPWTAVSSAPHDGHGPSTAAEQRWRSIISGDDRTIAGRLARGAMVCAEKPYRALVSIRNKQFDKGLRPIRRLGRSTISVGNLTTGGTGKTPVVVDLARRLLAMGKQPAVLLRGYKAAATGCDEALLIGESLGPSVPVGCGRSRLEAAGRVIEQWPQVDVFLLDDGFQHRQVDRDLDLVLVDATQPFGFGHVLPRGMLREPEANLRRADAVVVTRADHVSRSQLSALDQRIQQLTGKPPVAHTAHRWEGFLAVDGEEQPLSVLSHSRVVGVCGVGNPGAFARSLRDHSGEVITVHALGDHHHYADRPLRSLLQDARNRGADAVVTTHKDIVKWRPLLAGGRSILPVYYPVLRLFYLDGQSAIDTVLRETVAGVDRC